MSDQTEKPKKKTRVPTSVSKNEKALKSELSNLKEKFDLTKSSLEKKNNELEHFKEKVALYESLLGRIQWKENVKNKVNTLLELYIITHTQEDTSRSMLNRACSIASNKFGFKNDVCDYILTNVESDDSLLSLQECDLLKLLKIRSAELLDESIVSTLPQQKKSNKTIHQEDIHPLFNLEQNNKISINGHRFTFNERMESKDMLLNAMKALGVVDIAKLIGAGENGIKQLLYTKYHIINYN